MIAFSGQTSWQQKQPMQRPTSTKCYFRVDEVAVYFAILVRTVYRPLDMGDLHETRIRGCFRVPVEEIRRFEEILGIIAQK
jgi:excisionase family DNA binding protein